MSQTPQKDKTPAELMKEGLEVVHILQQHAHEIAQFRRQMYLEYIGVGFTEAQALELVKGQLM